MEKEKMLVTQALNELKLLDSRINREIRTASFVSAAKQSEKKVTPNVTKEEFNANAKSEMQSIEDLIDRRARIKKATVASNAITTLEVNGETMTVADALELKTSIEYQRDLLSTLKNQLSRAQQAVTTNNKILEEKIDNVVTAMVGNGDKKVSKDDYEQMTVPMREAGEYALVDPLQAEKKIAEMETYIEGFLSNVDSTLQISNCITYIEF